MRKVVSMVALIAALVISVAFIPKLSFAAPDPGVGPFILKPAGTLTKCVDSDVVYISKQFLPATGLVTHSAGIVDNDSTTGIIPELDNVVDNGSKIVRMTFVLENGSFSASSLDLVITDNTSATATITATPITANKVAFTIDNNSLSALSDNITSVALYDHGSSNTLSITVSGSLDNGGKVILSLTSEAGPLGGLQSFQNGCFRKVLYIVENQWVAHLCKCSACGNGIDTDELIATDNGLMVKDTKLGVLGASYYNACFSPSGTTTSPSCCNTIPGSCGLFCNLVTTSTSTTTGGCSMPGSCVDNCTVDGNYVGLKIYENKDLANSPYKVTNLNDATITFTLTADNIDEIGQAYLVGAGRNYGTTIAPFSKGKDSLTAQVSGANFFIPSNGGGSAPIMFSVKIVPATGVTLLPDKFYLSAEISGGSQMENPATLNWNEFLAWNFNGILARVPIMFYGGGYRTYINLFSDQPAHVVAIVTLNDGTKAEVDLGNIQPGKKFMKTAEYIVNAVKAMGKEVFAKDGVYQFNAQLLIVTTGHVDGYALFKQPGSLGTLRVPLYYNENQQGLDE